MSCPRSIAASLCACTLAILASCGPETDRAASSRTQDRPNVLLISIDSLRADRLGCYGAEAEVSPHIDRLAGEGTLFTDCLSSSSWTLPSHAALFTGLPDSAHGCDSNEARLSPSHETLAERLQETGYDTVGFWSGPYLHPIFGLAQGFERYIPCTGFEVFGAKSLEDALQGAAPRGEARANARSHSDVTGPRVLRAFEAYVDERESNPEANAPFFAFVHLWDVHYDYIAPAEWRERFADPNYEGPMDGSARAIFEATRGSRPGTAGPGLSEADIDQLRALYDAEVAWTDHHVGLILEKLRAADLLDNTIVVLTADHGEEFFEHGRFGHRKQLFFESLHVPLIVRLPGASSASRRSKLTVGGSDVAPTLLELVGLEAPTEMTGQSFATELPFGNETAESAPLNSDSQTQRAPVFSELVRLGSQRRLATARNENWAVLFEPENQRILGLWDRSTDRNETRDLSMDPDSETHRAWIEGGQLLLQRIRESRRPENTSGGTIPPELKQQLRALGYISD